MTVSDLPPDEIAALERLRRADANWPKTRWFLLACSILSIGISAYGRYRQGEALLELAKAPPGSISPVLFAIAGQSASLFRVILLLGMVMFAFTVLAWRGIPSRKLLLRLMADRESRQ